MLLIGGGALLCQAAQFAAGAGVTLDAVCCAPDDAALPRLRRSGLPLATFRDPATDLLPLLARCSDGVAFSVNNRHLLNDQVLDAGVRFFNIHGGLTQDYRGLAELCVFTALCGGVQRYGVTLHELLPGQAVDAGPVFAQRSFAIDRRDTFAQVMSQALRECQAVFEAHLHQVLGGDLHNPTGGPLGTVCRYRDVPGLCAQAPPQRLARAGALGPYAGFFPRLRALVAAHGTLPTAAH